MKQKLFLFIAVTSFAAVQALAQQKTVKTASNSPEILTDASIVELSKAGLGDDIILSKIAHSSANFDLSTAKLIELKKAGVSSAVIDAMMSKLVGVPVAAVTPAPVIESKPIVRPAVNPKDCKFTERKAADGKTFKFAQTSCKNGNLLLCRSGGKYTIIYDTKALLAFLVNDSKNQAMLRVDSVTLDFGPGNVVTVKAVNSYGKLANSNNQLQPQLLEVHLAIALDPNSRAEKLFLEKPLKFFLVRSEKDGKYADALNDKQQASWTQAIACMPDNN